MVVLLVGREIGARNMHCVVLLVAVVLLKVHIYGDIANFNVLILYAFLENTP